MKCSCTWEYPPDCVVQVMTERDPECLAHGDDSASWKRIQERSVELAEQYGIR